MNRICKILLITGGRADWGLLHSCALELEKSEIFELHILATGSHMSHKLGATVTEIQQDQFQNIHYLPILDAQGLSDQQTLMLTSSAKMLSNIHHFFHDIQPDFVLLLGDRYEIFTAATAAVMSNIPIIHVAGGDVTEGAVDDYFRHALTKLANLHFVTNERSKSYVLQMGEQPNCVFNIGSPGLDFLSNLDVMARQDFFKELDTPVTNKLFMLTFHPATREVQAGLTQVDEVLAAIETYLQQDMTLLITGSNADPEGAQISEKMAAFAQRYENVVFRDSLGHKLYFQALAHADIVLGNSSSGLYEVPSFKIPTVNIGERQKGRLKAESVFDCAVKQEDICEAIDFALQQDLSQIKNPYGDGQASKKMVQILSKIVFETTGNGQTIQNRFQQKRFFELGKKNG